MLITLIFILVIIIYIITLLYGIYYYYLAVPLDTNFYLKKSIWAFLIPVIYSIHSISSSILLNKLFIDCPQYDKDPKHEWFKNSLQFQILDILISLGIICLVTHWIRITSIKILDVINSTAKSSQINWFKSIKAYDFTKIPEKSGNVTVAFITFMFQRKLKNKFSFLLQKYKL